MEHGGWPMAVAETQWHTHPTKWMNGFGMVLEHQYLHNMATQ
jgi:hypothetical protein